MPYLYYGMSDELAVKLLPDQIDNVLHEMDIIETMVTRRLDDNEAWHNLTIKLCKLEDEWDFRFAREAFLESLYEDHKRIIFTTGSGDEWETESEALATAMYTHDLNDALLNYGADGEGIDDMIPPDRMVQALIVDAGYQID